MDYRRLPSFLVSLCLHLGLLALVLMAPTTSTLPDLSASAPMIAGMVTIGAPGKSVPGSVEAIPEPAKGPDESPQPIPSTPPSQPVQPVQPVQAEEPPVPIEQPKVEPKPDPVKSKPEPPKEDAVPIPKKIEEPKKEEPKKEEPKKEEKKPEPPKEKPKKEDKKPKEDKTKTEKPKDEKPKEDKKKTPPKKNANVDDALNELAKATGTPTGSSKGKGSVKSGKGKEHSSADDALRDLEKQFGGAGSDGAGRGPGGRGGHGMGRRGSYEQSIVASVRPNWSAVKRADRKKLSTSVRIAIGDDGTILGAKIVSSSGDKAFDDMIMYAIRKTRKLEPPQTPDQRDVVIRFTP